MFSSESARHARRGAILVEPGLAERLAAERQVEAQLHRLVALGGKVEDGAPALGVRHRLGEHPRDLAARGADLRLRLVLARQLAGPAAPELADTGRRAGGGKRVKAV